MKKRKQLFTLVPIFIVLVVSCKGNQLPKGFLDKSFLSNSWKIQKKNIVDLDQGYSLDRGIEFRKQDTQENMEFDSNDNQICYNLKAGIYLDKRQFNDSYFNNSVFRIRINKFTWGDDYSLGDDQLVIEYNNETSQFVYNRRNIEIREFNIAEYIDPNRYKKISSTGMPGSYLEGFLKENQKEYLRMEKSVYSPDRVPEYFGEYYQGILLALANRDYNAIKKITSKEKGLLIRSQSGVGLYERFYEKEEIVAPNYTGKYNVKDYYLEWIMATAQNMLELDPQKFFVYPNLFLGNNITEISLKFPSGVLFEIIGNKKCMISFLLVLEDSSWKLVYIKGESDYIADEDLPSYSHEDPFINLKGESE